jgi:hypothetical protein
MASTTLGSSASVGPPLVGWVGERSQIMSGPTQQPVDFSPSRAVHRGATSRDDNGRTGGGHGQDPTQRYGACGSGSKAKRCCYAIDRTETFTSYLPSSAKRWSLT